MAQVIEINTPVYASIKDTAQRTGVSVHFLRQRIAAKEIPFITSGNKYLVNVPRLLEQLEHEAMGGDAHGV